MPFFEVRGGVCRLLFRGVLQPKRGRGGGGLEVRDLLRLLRLEVLLARGEVLARGLQDLHHVAAALGGT